MRSKSDVTSSGTVKMLCTGRGNKNTLQSCSRPRVAEKTEGTWLSLRLVLSEFQLGLYYNTERKDSFPTKEKNYFCHWKEVLIH